MWKNNGYNLYNPTIGSLDHLDDSRYTSLRKKVTEHTSDIIEQSKMSPVIILTGSKIVNLHQGDRYTEYWATALDNNGAFCSVVSFGRVNTNILGSYEIKYNTQDTEGNITTATRIVNVCSLPAPDKL